MQYNIVITVATNYISVHISYVYQNENYSESHQRLE